MIPYDVLTSINLYCMIVWQSDGAVSEKLDADNLDRFLDVRTFYYDKNRDQFDNVAEVQRSGHISTIVEPTPTSRS